MASVVLDITTRGLDDAIQNVRNAKNLITAGTAVRMVHWYNNTYKRTALEVIETGNGVPDNVGRYALEKERKYGISHGLGVLTGGLYFSVSMAKPTVKETRGKEVRFAVRYDDPYYIAYVIDGTSNHIGRDFVTIARDKTIEGLRKSLGQIFDGLDFTLPYQQLLSTVLGPSTLPSLRSG